MSALGGSDSGAGSSEIEFKLALAGPEALEAVARAAERHGARRQGPAEQENHFFDAPGADLRRRGTVVRLRHEDRRFLLAVKGPRISAERATLHERTEVEVELDPDRARAILDARRIGLGFLLSALGPSAPDWVRRLGSQIESDVLVHVGSFRNERLRVGPLEAPGADPMTIELDRTELPGGRVDCEVELEVLAHAKEAGGRLLDQLLAEAHVVGRPTSSKAQRFFEALAAAAGDP